MSVEEMKEVHLKLHEGIWMNRNLELLDDVFGETFRFNMGRGEPMSKAQMTEMLKQSWDNMDNNSRKIVRTEYHGKQQKEICWPFGRLTFSATTVHQKR